MEEIIKLLDEADQKLRDKIKAHTYGSLAERTTLREAREYVQKAITVLLDTH